MTVSIRYSSFRLPSILVVAAAMLTQANQSVGETTITFNGEPIVYSEDQVNKPQVVVSAGEIAITIPGVNLVLDCPPPDEMADPLPTCKFTATQVVEAEPPPPPLIVTEAKATVVCDDLVCDFDGRLSTVDPANGPLTYSWSFTDPTASVTGSTAKHTYAQAGDYTAILTVTDELNATSSLNIPVEVTGPTVSNPSSYCDNTPSNTVCNPNTNLDSIYVESVRQKTDISGGSILAYPFTLNSTESTPVRSLKFTEISNLPVGFDWRFWLSTTPGGAVFRGDSSCQFIGSPRGVFYMTANPVWSSLFCYVGDYDGVLYANFAVRSRSNGSLSSSSFSFNLNKDFNRY
jgi:hypothetical protein